MRLYEIAEAVDAIAMMVDENGVLLPEAEAAFDALQMEKEKKFENIAMMIKNLDAFAEGCKEEEARLKLKKKVAENKAERLKGYLKFVLEKSNSKKYEAGVFTFSLRESNSIDVADPSKLPEEYQKVTIEPKKTELKEAMKGGMEFEGVTVVTNVSLQIR